MLHETRDKSRAQRSMLIAQDTDPGLAEEPFPGERCQLLRCTEGKPSSGFLGAGFRVGEEKEETPTGQGGGADQTPEPSSDTTVPEEGLIKQKRVY